MGRERPSCRCSFSHPLTGTTGQTYKNVGGSMCVASDVRSPPSVRRKGSAHRERSHFVFVRRTGSPALSTAQSISDRGSPCPHARVSLASASKTSHEKNQSDS